jgi:hypothetical protein|nr:MAG TPA: hypothetical protein [Caudoviricetes sp.]
MAKLISVTGVKGRVAYTAVRGGDLIPVGTKKDVPHTKWIQERLEAGDIALFKAPKKPETPAEEVKK